VTTSDAGAGESVESYVARFERLVVVAPHPDDEVLGCGGTLAAETAAGIDVVVVFVTDGRRRISAHRRIRRDACAPFGKTKRAPRSQS
jgi:LmbE family N-acetylglucosaminyl deacetylase